MRGLITLACLIACIVTFAPAQVSITKSPAGWELSNGHIDLVLVRSSGRVLLKSLRCEAGAEWAAAGTPLVAVPDKSGKPYSFKDDAISDLDKGGKQLTLHFGSYTGAVLSLVLKLYPTGAVIQTVMQLENRGQHDLLLNPHVEPLSLTLKNPAGGLKAFSSAKGKHGFYAAGNLSQKNEFSDWLVLENAGAGESMLIGGEPGLGVLGWRANVRPSAAGTVVQAGTILIKDRLIKDRLIKDRKAGPAATFELAPGATVETPVSFFAIAKGDSDNAGNETFRYLKQYVFQAPLPNSPLVTYCIWLTEKNSEEALLKELSLAKQVGFDVFYHDATWYEGASVIPGMNDWTLGLGSYQESKEKFPHGLQNLSDAVHAMGLKFGLWVDWSQAGLDTSPGALNLRDPTVRDWLVADVGLDWKPQEFKGQTIDLGVPAAHDYAAREVNRIVSDYHLDMLEHDGYVVAQGCTRDDHPHAAPDPRQMSIQHLDGSDLVLSSNSTDVSYQAVRSYYSIYEQLRRQHPGLLLEICNDGGRMVDFGSAAHGDYFSITDSYDPLSNRRAFYDTSFVLPAAMLETYEQKWPTPRLENFLYELRSGMMGWFTVMQDTNAWTAEQHAAARQAIKFYKTNLRPLIRQAELFHISPRPDGVHWDGMEYWDPAQRRGIVFAFRGSGNGQPAHHFVLAGLDPQKKYRLHFEDGSSSDTELTGRQLMSTGLMVALPLPLSSELISLTEKSETRVRPRG